MSVTGTFYMDIMAGLVGDKLYGGTAEWDDNLSIQNNIYRAMGYDPISGSVNWDYNNMPTFQSLIPTALQNIRDNQWKTTGSQQGSKWTIGGNANFYLNMVTGSWVMPVEDNWNYPTVGYGDYTYRLDFNYQGAGSIVFNSTAFAMQEGKTIIGYDIEHTVPLQTFNETNGYQSLDPDEHHIRYYSDPNLSPSGLLLFWEEVEGEAVPTKMYYVSVRRQENNVGTPTLYYRLISDEILSYVNLEEQEEEEMEFPASKLYNMFTTMYAMKPEQVEGLAQYLIQKADDYTGTDKTFMEKLLDDLGFQTGVVTDAIIDMTVYPFDIDNVCAYVTTHYLKLGFGADSTTGNLGVFHFPTSDLHKVTWLNTGELTIPPSGSGSVNFDSKITRFNDFRDYPPYRTFEMYIPYVGLVPIDQRKLYGKNIRLKYIIDFYSGNATAILLSIDGSDVSVVETWDCIMGVHQAVGTTNWTEYASRMNASKSQVTKTGLSLPTSLAKDPMGAIGGVLDATRNQATTEGIFTGNVNGTNSSMGNYFMPQYWYIIDYKQETSVTGNLSSLKGRASNTSGAISSFSGFLQVSDVDLICPQATDAEKAKIISLLESGVRI